MSEIDLTPENATLRIRFEKMWDFKSLMEVINDSPKDNLKKVLSAFYEYRLWQLIDSQDYESIGKLEYVMELHNLIK